MNPFSFVADSMRPTTTDAYFVQALLRLAGDAYSSGWTSGTDKRAYVVNYFKTRFGAESPVYTKLASLLN